MKYLVKYIIGPIIAGVFSVLIWLIYLLWSFSLEKAHKEFRITLEGAMNLFMYLSEE